MSLRLHFAVRSDVGHVREGNEDSAFAGPRLLAVADGMGGHAAGEVASSTVISQLAHLDEVLPQGDPLDALADSMDDANAQLRAMAAEDNALEGMGTTVTAMLSTGSAFGVLHVGDSRAYHLRDGVLSQVTHDHTLVQDLVDQGRITPEQANTHPQRSLLMRALDGRDVEPDLMMREAVIGDRYLLCTDGLSGVVTEETILEALLNRTPQEAVDRLVELALKGGGPDNITVVVADIVSDAETDEMPLVAGAAAEKAVVPRATPARTGPNPRYPDQGESAAAKGAKFGRQNGPRTEADDPKSDPDPDTGAGGRSRRPLFLGLVAVILLAVVAGAGWYYVRTQYYVGVKDDKVTIFKGIQGDPLGISLSSVERKTSLSVSDLPLDARRTVEDGYTAGSLTEANNFVAKLEDKKLTSTAPVVTPTVTATSTAAGKSPNGAAGTAILPTTRATCTPAPFTTVAPTGCVASTPAG